MGRPSSVFLLWLQQLVEAQRCRLLPIPIATHPSHPPLRPTEQRGGSGIAPSGRQQIDNEVVGQVSGVIRILAPSFGDESWVDRFDEVSDGDGRTPLDLKTPLLS